MRVQRRAAACISEPSTQRVVVPAPAERQKCFFCIYDIPQKSLWIVARNPNRVFGEEDFGRKNMPLFCIVGKMIREVKFSL